MGINDTSLLRHHRVEFARRSEPGAPGARHTRPGHGRIVLSIAVVVIAFWGAAGL